MENFWVSYARATGSVGVLAGVLLALRSPLPTTLAGGDAGSQSAASQAGRWVNSPAGTPALPAGG
jgi:hypothetical protein